MREIESEREMHQKEREGERARERDGERETCLLATQRLTSITNIQGATCKIQVNST